MLEFIEKVRKIIYISPDKDVNVEELSQQDGGDD